MSQYPSYPPPHQPAYPGGPAQYDWQRLYGYPLGAPRPGVLSAIGVFSILIASISFLGSGFYALTGLVMFQTAKITTTLSTSSSSAYNGPVQGMAATPAGQGGTNGVLGATPGGARKPPQPGGTSEPTGRGMGRTDRATVLAALEMIEQMTDGQKQQLDAILARGGLDFFPHDDAVTPASHLSAADVSAAVKTHGTMPSAEVSEEDPVYFNMALGHLELHDDRAVFRFTDPTEPAVRTSAPTEEAVATEPPRVAAPPVTPAAAPSDDPFAPPPLAQADPFANPDMPSTQPGVPTTIPAAKPAGTGLSQAQSARVIQKVQAACGNKLNPSQVAALATALAKSDQQLVTPGTLWSPVSTARIQPDGSVVLKMNGGYLEIDPQGTISNQMATGFPKVRLNPMPIALVVAESVASLALAGFLMFSGIFLLKQSPRGRRLHQIFALIKIPLAVIAIAGFSWMMADLASNLRRFPGGSGPGNGFVTFGIVLAASGLIYPIVLLIAMQTKTVREYYRTMSADA